MWGCAIRHRATGRVWNQPRRERVALCLQVGMGPWELRRLGEGQADQTSRFTQDRNDGPAPFQAS